MKHIKLDTYEKFKSLMRVVCGEPVGVDQVSHFYRSFEFCALVDGRKVTAKLTWFHNLCTVSIGLTQIMATHASVDGCWPNRARSNLNLSMDGIITHAAIALESYDN